MSRHLILPHRSVSFRAGLRRSTAVLGLFAASLAPAVAADWKVTQGANEVGPGQNVSVTVDGRLVARLIYGEGQQKPFVAVYVPTNHLYLGDIALHPRAEVLYPDISVEEGIRVVLTGGMSLPGTVSDQARRRG